MSEDAYYRKWILVYGALFLAGVFTWVHFFPIYFSREQLLDVLRREATSDTFKSGSRGAKLIDFSSLDGRRHFIRLVETAKDCNETRIANSADIQRVAVETREISFKIRISPNRAGEGMYLIIESHRGIKGRWLRLLSQDAELIKRYDPSTMKALP